MNRARRASSTSLGNRIRQRVRHRTLDRRVGEAADAVELRFLQERQHSSNSASVSPGKTDDERAAQRDVRLAARHARMRVELLGGAGRFISFRMRGLACWKGTSRYGRSRLARSRRHQRNHFVDMRIGVDVVQPHPRAVRPGRVELARKLMQRVFVGLPCQKPVRYRTSTP